MHIAQYLLAGAYSGYGPLSAAAATCSLNGQTVDCSPAMEGIATSVVILLVLLGVLLVISTWKIFTKAGKPGWASLVPIYNIVVMLEIARKPTWWVVLMFIPFVNVIVSLIMTHEFARAFGKGIGYTIGLIVLPFIFMPMLAFGDATYQPDSAPITV